MLVGDDVPKGRDAVGWHIAVYWKDDKTFYGGEIIDFENSTGRHKVRAGASAVLGWPRSPLYAVISAQSADTVLRVTQLLTPAPQTMQLLAPAISCYCQQQVTCVLYTAAQSFVVAHLLMTHVCVGPVQ